MIIKRNFRNNNTPNTLPTKTSVFDSIDASQIGEGKYFTEGKFGDRKNLGLKGQLSKIKRVGGLFTKNLSKKNLNDMYSIISNRLKKHSRGYGVNITRNDKMSIMQEAEKLIHTKGAKFSREDKEDLEKIVDSLKQQSKNNILNKRHSVESSEIKNTSLLRNKDRDTEPRNLHLNNPIRPSNITRNNYKSEDNLDDKKDELEEIASELEKNLNIPRPSETNDEIEELRNQAKDLAI